MGSTSRLIICSVVVLPHPEGPTSMQLGAVARVDLPLALPYVFGGLRVAMTTVVGLVTVTALIGLGASGG